MSAHDYGQVGFCKRQAGDFDGAIDQFTKGIELDKDEEFLYSQRAAAKEGKGDFKGAVLDLNEVIRIRKAMNVPYMLPYYYEQRGTNKQKTGDLIGAINDFTRAIQFEGGSRPYRLRSIAKLALGDQTGSLADFYVFVMLEIERLRPARESEAIRTRGFASLVNIFSGYHNIYESYIGKTMETNQKAGMVMVDTRQKLI